MLIYRWHNTSPFLTDIKQTITNGNGSYLVVSHNNIPSFIKIYVTFRNHKLKWLDNMRKFPLKYAYVIENEHMCYWNVHKTIVIMSILKFMDRIWQACTNMTYTCTILGIQTDALFSYFLSQNSATTINLWPFAQYIKKYLILIRGCNKK
jgi:hypothetical protein